MRHRIDPKVDCVFKALLGSEENRNLLIHFLNAMLSMDLIAPITAVDILNPYNDREFLDDKLSVVDVKARDDRGQVYQVEIQLRSHCHLPARILYNWAEMYSQQLQSGNDYSLLRPTYAIWLLGENLIRTDNDYLHAYRFCDKQGRTLVDHGGVWLLELAKFTSQCIENEQQRWLQFFRKGDQLDDSTLPNWMNTPEMRQAMSTLQRFSEKERDYHAYQARQNFIREQNTIQWEKEQALKEKEAALQEKEAALQEKEAALQEKEAALQEKEAISREKEAISREKDLISREKEVALREKESALAEMERLKALLADRSLSQ